MRIKYSTLCDYDRHTKESQQTEKDTRQRLDTDFQCDQLAKHISLISLYMPMEAALVYTGWLHQKTVSLIYFHCGAQSPLEICSSGWDETMTRPNIEANIENCYCQKRKIRESFVLAHSLRPHSPTLLIVYLETVRKSLLLVASE